MAQKKNGLRRVGAWCARLIARVSKHSNSGSSKKQQHHQHQQHTGGSVTENESWITTTQRTHRMSAMMAIGSPSMTETTDRAPSSLNPVSRRTGRSYSTSSRASSRGARVSSQQRPTYNTNESILRIATMLQSRASSSALLSAQDDDDNLSASKDELSLIASQRLHVAGLYAQAQHLKKKKLRELSYERRMQKPLSHIQVRRRLRREKEVSASGAVITPAFVSIRKAALGRDARHRLQIVGLDADDSVPPWIPADATTGDRWSCEHMLGSPRSTASAEFDQKVLAAPSVRTPELSKLRQLRSQPTAAEPQDCEQYL